MPKSIELEKRVRSSPQRRSHLVVLTLRNLSPNRSQKRPIYHLNCESQARCRRGTRSRCFHCRSKVGIRLCPAVESFDSTGDRNKRPDRSGICRIEIDASWNPRYERQPAHRGPTAAGRVTSGAGSESVLRCHRQSFFTRGSDHYAIPTPETISPIHYRELLPKQRRQRELPRFSSKVREASLTWSGYSDELHTIQTHRRSIFRI